MLGIANRPAEEQAVRYSSSACSMHEAERRLHGLCRARTSSSPVLNELLEAERAGARVALRRARDSRPGTSRRTALAVQRDEARWCAMLVVSISEARASGPRQKTGAFHGKAMAIIDLRARIAFLNRGQGWVVRKLREMLPRVRADDLHAGLSAMLRSHELNMDLVNSLRVALIAVASHAAPRSDPGTAHPSTGNTFGTGANWRAKN